MLILPENDIYIIKHGTFAMNRKLEKLMSAEQLDISAIINELDNNLQNGTNPYIIWDRFMHECVKVGCVIIEKKNIELPTFFLKNGRELRSDLIARMNWCKAGFCEDGKPCFESRFRFCLGPLSYSDQLDYGKYVPHLMNLGTTDRCKFPSDTLRIAVTQDTEGLVYFYTHMNEYVKKVKQVLCNFNAECNRMNKAIIKQAGSAYEF